MGQPPGTGGGYEGGGPTLPPYAFCQDVYSYYFFNNDNICRGQMWAKFTVINSDFRIKVEANIDGDPFYEVIGYANYGTPFKYYPHYPEGEGPTTFKVTCLYTWGTEGVKDDSRVNVCYHYRDVNIKLGLTSEFKITYSDGEHVSDDAGITSTEVNDVICYPPYTLHPTIAINCNTNASYFLEYVELDWDGTYIQTLGAETDIFKNNGCLRENIPLGHFNQYMNQVPSMHYLEVRFTTIYDGCTNMDGIKFKSRSDDYPVNILVSATQDSRNFYPGEYALENDLIADGINSTDASHTEPAQDGGIILTGVSEIYPVLDDIHNIQNYADAITIQVNEYDSPSDPSATPIIDQTFTNPSNGAYDYASYNLNDIKAISNFFPDINFHTRKNFFIRAVNSKETNSYNYNNPPTKIYEVIVEIKTTCGKVISGKQRFDIEDDPIFPLTDTPSEKLNINTAIRSSDKNTSKGLPEIHSVQIYNLQGMLINNYRDLPKFHQLQKDMNMGVYFQVIQYEDGSAESKKLFIR